MIYTEFANFQTPAGSLRNNLTGPVGHTIIPAINLYVTHVGRWYHSGNSQNHIVRIWQNGVTGAAVAAGTVLATAASDSLGYKWVALTTPIQLTAGTTYHVVSEEVNSGDQWPDEFNWDQYTDHAILDLTGTVFGNGGANTYPNTSSAGNNGYGSAVFKYVTSSPSTPTGEVQLIGTVIKSGEDGTNTAAKAIDGSFTTFWQSASANTGWIGLDAGAAVEISRVRFAPRPGTASVDHELKVEGSLVQASSASDFSGSPTLLDTLPTRPTAPFAPRYELTERELDPSGQTFRYYRLINTGTGKYGGMFSEMRWIAQGGANTTTNARPMAPTITPGGGRYPEARCEVSLSCETLGVDIYYTTDGSAPNWENGTLYTEPFWIQWTDSKTVKAIAYHPRTHADGSEVASRTFYDWGFRANANWYDSDGVLIEAHAGHVLDDRERTGYFYLVGHSMNCAFDTNIIDQRLGMGLWLYRSTDLLNWTRIGNILGKTLLREFTERPHLLFCANTSKYVLWCHARASDGSTNSAAVAQSDDIESGWAWVDEDLDPDGLGYKDCTVFQDDDPAATAYTIYTRGDQNGMVISKLSSDYLSTTGDYIEVLSGSPAESPAMFKRNGIYFLVTGSANAYNSDNQAFATKYRTATDPLGTWSSDAYLHYSVLHGGEPVGTDYNAQVTQVLHLPEYADGYIFLGDYWTADQGAGDLYNSRAVWLPLFFPDDYTMQLGEPTDWTIGGSYEPAADPVAPYNILPQ